MNMKDITEIYAIVCADEGQGIVADEVEILGKAVLMPMVVSNNMDLNFLKQRAKKIAKMTGKKLKLIKFSNREEIEEI